MSGFGKEKRKSAETERKTGHELLEKAIKLHQNGKIFEAEQLGKMFTHQVIPDADIKGFPALLGSAVENVIRNALRYASNQVNLAIISDADKITFVITDDGPGVPDDEVEQIFKPFYRVSQARDRESGGAGLGLAITENAIRQHHGEIVASNRETHGLQVSITIPIS